MLTAEAFCYAIQTADERAIGVDSAAFVQPQLGALPGCTDRQGGVVLSDALHFDG